MSWHTLNTRLSSLRALTLLLLCAAAIPLLAACGSGQKQNIQYQTVPAERGPLTARVSATGTLSALVTVQVGSQVSGRIKTLNVDYNSRVTKGELLATIDTDLFKAAVDNARANKIAAEANLLGARVQAANAKLQFDRAQQLLTRGIVAQADYDTAKATYDGAVAAVSAAEGALEQTKAQLSQTELNLSYTPIVSPINGMVISRNVDIGQTVAASLQAPVLFLIAEDLRKMQVDTSVAEADVGKLRDGMAATFTVDAFPNDRFTGVIRQIRNNSTTVQNVVTYDAVIDVSNPELRLRPGMTATVTVVIAERTDALRVPNAALRYRPPLASGNGGLGGAGAAQGGGMRASPGGQAGGPVMNPGGGGSVASSPGADRPIGGSPPSAPAAASPGLGQMAGARPDRTATPDQRTVWRLLDGKPQPVRIRIGITDGTLTEVVSGDLNAGDLIITDASGGEQRAQGVRAF
jgi:HlyD family secretion protein